ncbi:hypothetical protein [Bradyrhizobium sp.]|uniref:hypothetical protein n=1 Tax=Bradyrhizobium sp. TaxID=376 RepID=UPI0025C63428|nr:hypothetical protein [Bradyrhizobium sp.]
MGNVVEFEPKSGKTTDPACHAADIASLSLALADHMQTIDVCRRSFEKDMKTITSIACGTQDPKVRERLLRELELLHDRLTLALLTASGAKRSMQAGL